MVPDTMCVYLRCYLVNMRYIQTIDTKQITLKTLSPVPVAQGKAGEIKARYLAYYTEGEGEQTDDKNCH